MWRLDKILGPILCLGIGMISGWLSNSGPSLWYDALLKPTFNPPAWIFGPVWTGLYLMIGYVFGRLWIQSRKHFYALSVHFLFNLAWSPLFFGLHQITWAFYDLLILWGTLIAFMIWGRSLKIVFLLIPYALWITFALILNFEIIRLNNV
jgi:benzodiazapine receptor